jgi:subtilisin family serine protease
MRTVPRRSSLALLAAVIGAFAAPSIATAAEGQIIVKYAAGADARDRSEARADADVVRSAALPLAHTELVTPERGTTVTAAVADLERSADVAYAEPDRPRSAFDDGTPTTDTPPTTEPPAPTTANDPGFADQWALENTGMQQIWSGTFWYVGTPGDDIDIRHAWDLAGTEAAPTVAVIDSGMDLVHPDLKANIAPGGKDFVDGDDIPNDKNGHGTHVAGTIGAVGNNSTGVSGVAWKAHLLPIRVLNAKGEGSVSTVLQGEEYAAAAGIKVVNMSLGGASPSQTEYDVLRTASSTLFVVAAGNDSANVDASDSYPCAYDLPNVVCVAATGGNDELADFSNYGANTVDIAAPGVDILSTWPIGMRTSTNERPGYDWLSGTSMATPEVSGAAALLLSQDDTLTPWQVRAKLIAGADQVAGLKGKVSSGGRLDVFGAMSATPPPPDGAPAAALVAPKPRAVATTPTSPTPATPAIPTMAPTPTAPATAAPTTTAPKPVTVADHRAPSVTPALAGRHGLKLLLASRLKASVTTSERATVRFELRLDGRTAKRLHLSKRASAAVRIATGRATLTTAGTKAGKLRLTRAAKRALARARSVRVTVRATATDAAGNARTRTATVTLTR